MTSPAKVAAVKAAAPKKTAPAPLIPVQVPPAVLPRSVFAKLKQKVYSHRYRVRLHVGHLVGGTPTNEKVAEGWIRTKMGLPTDEQIQAAVEETMRARGVTAKVAAEEVARDRNLSGFKRNFDTPMARLVQQQASTVGVEVLNRDNRPEHRVFTPEEAAATFGELYIEGRQIKAMLKEGTNIALGAGAANMGVKGKGWGETRKGIQAYLVEHMFVPDEQVLLGVTDPSRVQQSFVHTWRGAGIKLEEHLDEAIVEFEVHCDVDFEAADKDFWGKVMVRCEMNGLGSSRSQGFGTFSTVRFEKWTGKAWKSIADIDDIDPIPAAA